MPFFVCSFAFFGKLLLKIITVDFVCDVSPYSESSSSGRRPVTLSEIEIDCKIKRNKVYSSGQLDKNIFCKKSIYRSAQVTRGGAQTEGITFGISNYRLNTPNPIISVEEGL